MHISKNTKENPFLEHFSVHKNKITKIAGDGLWHCIKC